MCQVIRPSFFWVVIHRRLITDIAEQLNRHLYRNVGYMRWHAKTVKISWTPWHLAMGFIKGHLLRSMRYATTQNCKHLVYSATKAWNLAFPGDGRRNCSTCLTNDLVCCYWNHKPRQELAEVWLISIGRQAAERVCMLPKNGSLKTRNLTTLEHNVPSSMVSHAVYPLMPD
jgi:hypothetical protein